MNREKGIGPDDLRKRIDLVEEVERAVNDAAIRDALIGNKEKIVIKLPTRKDVVAEGTGELDLSSMESPEDMDLPIEARKPFLKSADDMLVNFGASIIDVGQQVTDKITNIRLNTKGVIGTGVVTVMTSGLIATPAVAAEKPVVAEETSPEEVVVAEDKTPEFEVSFKSEEAVDNAKDNSKDKEHKNKDIKDEHISNSGDTSTRGVEAATYEVVVEASSKAEAESDDSTIKVTFDEEGDSTKDKPTEAELTTGETVEEVSVPTAEEVSVEEVDERAVEEATLEGASKDAVEDVTPVVSEVVVEPEAPVVEDVIVEDTAAEPETAVAPQTPISEDIQVSFPEEIPTEAVPEMDEPEIEVVVAPPVTAAPSTVETWTDSGHETTSTPKKVIVQKGQTLIGIAKDNGKTKDELIRWNKDRYPSLETNADLIHIGDELFISSPLQSVIVQEGQTLGEIAEQQGTTVAEIVASNPTIDDENFVLAGAEIFIPAKQSETPEQTTVSKAVVEPEVSPTPEASTEKIEPRLSTSFGELLEQEPLLETVEAFSEYKWDTTGDGSPDQPLLKEMWNDWSRAELAQALLKLGNSGWISYDKGVELVLNDIVNTDGYSLRYGNDGDDLDKDDPIEMNRNLLRTLAITAALLPKDKLYIANLTDGGHIGDSNHFTDKRDSESKYGLGNAFDIGDASQADWLNLIGDGLVLNQRTIGGFRELILTHPDFDGQMNHGKPYTYSDKTAAGHGGNNLHIHASFMNVLTDDPGIEAPAEKPVEKETDKSEVTASKDLDKLTTEEIYKAQSTEELIELGFTTLERIPDEDKAKFDSVLASIPTIQYAIDNYNSRQGDSWGPTVPATAILAIAYDLGERGDDLLDTVTTLSGESGLSPFVIGDDKGKRVDGMLTRLAVGIGQFFESDNDGFDASELAEKQALLHPAVAVNQVIEWKSRRGLKPWYFYLHRDPKGAWGGHYERIEDAAQSIDLVP